MRIPAALFSSLLFFAILLIASPSRSSAQTPLLDTDGNPIRPGVDYYAVPPAGKTTGGGGLGLQSAANVNCPLDVVQELNRASNGLPLYFLPANGDDKVVNLGSDSNVLFNASSICVMTTLWTLRPFSDGTRGRYVTTGGVVGNPGRQTLSNWFSVDRFEDGYKFYYCPGVCEICRPACGNIGVIVEKGRRLLGISDQPLKVVFKRVQY